LVAQSVRRRPDGGARIHTVLKQATRTTIKAAFTATGVPFAQSSFERAMGHMETWAATWEQQHVNTCLSKVRAELPREHAGLQDSCLEDQLARYAGLVDLFGDADTDVVRTAIDATTRLPEPQMCARPEVLATAVSRADSAQAPKIRRELARVEGLLSAERGADAKAAAQQLYTQATELELTELIHRATLDLGLALIEVGEHEEGHERLREAYFQSLAAGNDLDALDAAVALIDANSRIHPRYEQAHGWAKTAEALVSRLGRKGSALQARVLHALGNLATHEKSARHGAELYQRAYELRVATLPSGHPDIASSILSLGNVALDRENVSEAFDHYTKNLEMLRANLGAMHPHTARALSNLGNLELRRVRYEAAIARYREAFSVLEPLGPENYEATVVLQNLGAALYHSGEHREALATWEQALALRKLQLAPDNPDIGELSANIAAVHSSLGDHEQALAALLETRESFVLSLGAKHSRVARVHNNIASILVRLHRYDEARPHAEQSLTLHIHNSGEDSEPTARSRTLLAQILLELGEFAQARQQLERALAFLRLEPGDQLMEWSAKFRLAQLDWHAGHRKRARAQLDVLREARGRKNADDVDTWLAEHDP
ncbi:MAG: tetratricopeptide repeat protein, partial [Nannocystaceae bacterium]